MTTSITNAVQTNPAAPTATPAAPVVKSASVSQRPTAPQAASAAPVDTVQISSAAKAALQETTETQTQTVQEAQRRRSPGTAVACERGGCEKSLVNMLHS